MEKSINCRVCGGRKYVTYRYKTDPMYAPVRGELVKSNLDYHKPEIHIRKINCSQCGLLYDEESI